MHVLIVVCTSLLYVCRATPNVQLVPLGTEYNNFNSRIVGGSNVPENEFPKWQVSLRRSNSHICGAVIIDTTTVLTAAHCVDNYENSPSSFTIGVGHVNRNNHEIYHVSKITMHENYNKGNGAYPHDIAILTVWGEIEFKDFVGAISMRTTDSNNLDGYRCTLTGWGRTSGTSSGIPTTLQTTDIALISDARCSGNYWGSNINNDAHVCVQSNGVGACNGDSGGPLTCVVGGSPQLVGLASWVYNGCVTSFPSVYVDVATYVSWVMDNK